MKKALVNCTVCSGNEIKQGQVIVCEDDIITAVQQQIPAGIETTDMQGTNIAPGMIDIQIAPRVAIDERHFQRRVHCLSSRQNFRHALMR